MKISQECVGCIVNQSQRVADAIDADEALRKQLLSYVTKASHSFSFSLTPPEIAADVYADMARIANKEDLYAKLKEASTQKARSLLPKLKTLLQKSDDKLLSAVKIAVAGNVIDLAAAVSFDLDEELAKIFHTDFAIDDVALLQVELQKAKQIVVLGDNVGEHIFDYLFIETLQELFGDKEFYYFVRGRPIINDVTMKEAREAGFEDLCHLVDSGVDTPGFAYSRATHEAQKIFDEADIVISKGMGNYESLSPSHRSNICFLLKVKCSVVVASLGKELGDIICKMI